MLRVANSSTTQLGTCLSLHSMNKNQELLFPFGYTTERVPNFDQLRDLAREIVEEMKKATGTVYEYGSIAETLCESTYETSFLGVMMTGLLFQTKVPVYSPTGSILCWE